MKLSPRSAAFAALALALTTAAPMQAQTIGIGQGSYQALTSTAILDFTYVVRDTGNGTADGFAVWRGPDNIILWRVTSVMTLPNSTAQAFAGPIVAVLGTPPSPLHVVGATAFTASIDNGSGVPDQTASLSVVPPPALVLAQLTAVIGPAAAAAVMAQVGGLTTIQQIVLLGQLVPVIPGPTFTPLLRGNIWVH